MLEGYASSLHIGADRTRFAASAFTIPERPRSIPLLVNHDVTAVAGAIEELAVDAGRLRVRAWVTSSYAARLPAFSLGARVLGYELRDAGGSAFH